MTSPASSTLVREIAYRSFDPDRDYPAAAALVSSAHEHDGVAWLPTSEVLRHEFEHSANFRPGIDARVAEVGDAMAGLVTGEWRLRAGKVVHHLELWVAPAHRRNGIGDTLLSWVEAHEAERVRGGAGGRLDLRHEIDGSADLALAGPAQLPVKHGYAAIRYWMELRRSIDGPIPEVALPPGLEVRAVRPDHHRRIWVADVEAFRDHWEAGERTETDFEAWFSDPKIDTGLWQVAWDGDEVAGSVLTSIDGAENERLGVRRAWLDHVSVRRPWRRRGLAAALIVSTLRLLRERGIDEAALGVDAENPSGAVRLYERLGFGRWRTGVSYRKALSLD